MAYDAAAVREVDTQLVEDVADVTMHRSLAHEQLGRDRMVRLSGGDQPLVPRARARSTLGPTAEGDAAALQLGVDPGGTKSGEGLIART